MKHLKIDKILDSCDKCPYMRAEYREHVSTSVYWCGYKMSDEFDDIETMFKSCPLDEVIKYKCKDCFYAIFEGKNEGKCAKHNLFTIRLNTSICRYFKKNE